MEETPQILKEKVKYDGMARFLLAIIFLLVLANTGMYLFHENKFMKMEAEIATLKKQSERQPLPNANGHFMKLNQLLDDMREALREGKEVDPTSYVFYDSSYLF